MDPYLILVDPGGGSSGIHVVDLGGSTRRVLLDQFCGSWWIPAVDPDVPKWWNLVDPDGAWWIYAVHPGVSTWWIMVDQSVGYWWIHMLDPV